MGHLFEIREDQPRHAFVDDLADGAAIEALECGCRSSARDDFRVGADGQRFDVFEQRPGRVFQDHLGLILNLEQIVQASFAHERAMGENSNAIADFLNLCEKMRGEQDRDFTSPKIDNQIANLARPRWIDAGGRLIEHDELRVVDQRLGKTDALQHSFRIRAQSPIACAR